MLIFIELRETFENLSIVNSIVTEKKLNDVPLKFAKHWRAYGISIGVLIEFEDKYLLKVLDYLLDMDWEFGFLDTDLLAQTFANIVTTFPLS